MPDRPCDGLVVPLHSPPKFGQSARRGRSSKQHNTEDGAREPDARGETTRAQLQSEYGGRDESAVQMDGADAREGVERGGKTHGGVETENDAAAGAKLPQPRIAEVSKRSR